MTARTATHATTDRSSLDKTFTAALQKSRATGGWTFVVTDWTAEFFGTPRPRQGRRDRRRAPLPRLLHALGDGSDKLPIKADLRYLINKREGDAVTIHLSERLSR